MTNDDNTIRVAERSHEDYGDVNTERQIRITRHGNTRLFITCPDCHRYAPIRKLSGWGRQRESYRCDTCGCEWEQA